MTKFLLVVMTLLTAANAYAQSRTGSFRPDFWLRADSPTAGDASGRGVRVWSPAGASPITLSVINFHPAYYFDGVDDIIHSNHDLSSVSGLTTFMVYSTADTVERGLWRVHGSGDRRMVFTTHHAAGPHDVWDRYATGSQQAVLATLTQAWDKPGSPDAAARLTIGDGDSTTHTYYKGSLAELLVFDDVLDFLERTKVSTYLAIKYGISLQGVNYVSSANTVLWRQQEEGPFTQRIAAIGRDDVYGLYQKQSSSQSDTHSLLTLAAGQLALTNAANQSTITDQHFLVWGDNGAPLERTYSPDSTLLLLKRRWSMRVTGSGMSSCKTQVLIDPSGLPVSREGYWLVIDRSGTGTYTSNQLEIIKPLA